MELRRRESTWSTGNPMHSVYFPESGAAAMIATTESGGVLDIGIIGREGFIGVERFFGIANAGCSSLILLPGVAGRMSVAAFEGLCQPGSSLHHVVRRYAAATLAGVAHSALCDATHSIRHRCVRRLLALHDAAGSDHFPLTQQVLATLLGVRRASVSVAAEKLQQAGLIVYEHGRMHVADRAGLERAACGCYGYMKSHAREIFAQAQA